MCASCAEGYGSKGALCHKCLNSSLNSFYYVLMTAMTLAGLVFTLKAAVKRLTVTNAILNKCVKEGERRGVWRDVTKARTAKEGGSKRKGEDLTLIIHQLCVHHHSFPHRQKEQAVQEPVTLDRASTVDEPITSSHQLESRTSWTLAAAAATSLSEWISSQGRQDKRGARIRPRLTYQPTRLA